MELPKTLCYDRIGYLIQECRVNLSEGVSVHGIAVPRRGAQTEIP